MTAQQPEWILTQDDWNRLKEHLVIGCTNQQKFLATLRPHPPAPKQFPMQLRSCFGDFGDCPCDDECVVSEYCAKYHEDHEKNSCGMTSSQCSMVQEYEKTEAARAATLAENTRVLCHLKEWFDVRWLNVTPKEIDVLIQSLRAAGDEQDQQKQEPEHP
jgi:hypothetical protein